MDGSLWTLVESSIATSIEFSLGIILGVIISHPKVGILSNYVVLKTISKSLIFFFLPCYILRSFAMSTDFAILKQLFVILVVATVLQIIQLLLGELFYTKVMYSRWGEVYRRVCALSLTFNNTTFFPLVFLTSLVENSGIFLGDDPAENAVLYISLYAVPPRILFYSFAMLYVSGVKDEGKGEKKDEEKLEAEKLEITPLTEKVGRWETLKMNAQASKFWKITRPDKVAGVLKNVFSPPIIALILGVTISLIPPVKSFFFVNPPQILKGIPSILLKVGLVVKAVPNLIIGANLGRLFLQKWNNAKVDPTQMVLVQTLQRVAGMFKLKHLRYWDAIKLVVIKLVAMPIITITLLWILIVSQLGAKLFPDPLQRPLQYMLFIVESSTPHVVTLPILLNMFDVGVEIISEIMLVMYCVAPLTMTLWATFGIYFVCSYEQCNL